MLQAHIWEKTGETRCPQEGEDFVGYARHPITAQFDFHGQEFEILRTRRVPIADVAHEGDPCKYCDTPHDEVSPGPCKGKCFDGFFVETAPSGEKG